MKKITRYLFTTLGVVAISLFIVIAVYAFSVGNIDGVWGWADGVAETSSTSAGGGGAYCSRWGTGAGDAVTTWSNWDKAIQTLPNADENQIRYGLHAYSPENGWNCETCPNTDWADQSGFGFDGNNGPVSPAADTPFYLGKFIHYNKTIFVTDCSSGNPTSNNRNAFTYTDLAVSVPITCNDGTTSTSFSFNPHFTLDETTNTAGECSYDDPSVPNDVPCPDKVTVTQPGTATFTCPDGTYTVNILGFTTTGLSGQACNQSFNPASVATEFVTQELQENPACLWAEITAPTADISTSKTCNGFDGQSPYYRVVTVNAGPGSAFNPTFVDSLPGGVAFSSYTSQVTLSGSSSNQGACSYNSATRQLSCQLLRPLPPTTVDATARWTVIIRVNYGGTTQDFDNTITVTSSTSDPVTANNTSTATCQPTAVELKSFTARRAKNSILLQWETASETGILGFNLYRAASPTAEKIRLNPSLIAARPGSQFGADYMYTDTGLEAGETCYYWLEYVDTHGAVRLAGPELVQLLAGKQ